MTKPKLDPNWRVRRAMTASSMLYLAGLSTFAVLHSPAMATAVLPYTMPAFAAFGIGYVFGAAYERRGGNDAFAAPGGYAGGPGE